MPTNERLKNLLFRSRRITEGLRALRVVSHYLRRSPHEADFEFLRDARYANGLLLDLGANIGQSAISVAKVQPGLSVMSIEANPACESGLKMTRLLLGRRFSYRVIGVGASAGELTFHVPVRSSRMLLEEGTFDPTSLHSPAAISRLGELGRDYTLTTLRVPLTSVDALDLSPAVIKMDLQGLEMAALLGMPKTLQRARPAVMVEIGDRHAEVSSHLLGLGYTAHFWNGSQLIAGQQQGGLNAIFLSAS